MDTITGPALLPVLRRGITCHIDDLDIRQAESGRSEDYIIRGHAAVYNSLSEDLGGFRELIAPGAFRAVLRTQPDVRLLYGHNSDSLPPLARTASGSLELREDTTGLHVWARVAPTTFAQDLRTSMQRGDVDQMSFAFTVSESGDTWAVADDGTVVRTINADGVDGLYDVSVVTYPAYTATDANMREVLVRAMKAGKVPPEAVPAVSASAPEIDIPVAGQESLRTDASVDGGRDDGRHKRLTALRASSSSAVLTYLPAPED